MQVFTKVSFTLTTFVLSKEMLKCLQKRTLNLVNMFLIWKLTLSSIFLFLIKIKKLLDTNNIYELNSYFFNTSSPKLI